MTNHHSIDPLLVETEARRVAAENDVPVEELLPRTMGAEPSRSHKVARARWFLVRRLAEMGHGGPQVARALGLSQRAVGQILSRPEPTRLSGKMDDETRARLIDAMRLARHNREPIEIVAAQFGVSTRYISWFARHTGVVRPNERWNGDPNAAVIAIPAWVPADMHADYREIAEGDGEHEAASWARAEKALRRQEGRRAA